MEWFVSSESFHPNKKTEIIVDNFLSYLEIILNSLHSTTVRIPSKI